MFSPAHLPQRVITDVHLTLDIYMHAIPDQAVFVEFEHLIVAPFTACEHQALLAIFLPGVIWARHGCTERADNLIGFLSCCSHLTIARINTIRSARLYAFPHRH